ncbi:MAG: 4Fe-4S dicluster domain-containing protein [Alphaproteobacteria bacterium]|nr:4Fe-4S dicluster domain-containing protein [Alphaproteobacteria bacterium]
MTNPAKPKSSKPDAFVMDANRLDALIGALASSGHAVMGPRVADGAVILGPVAGAADLPLGVTDRQEPGRYRLKTVKKDPAYFDFAVGPHTWKKFLFPPREKLWSAERAAKGFAVREDGIDAARRDKLAFVGVRACELAAIAAQDRVLTGGEYRSETYALRREQTFIVAVNCRTSAATCFCASMNTGPGVGAGHDLALTELGGGKDHRFLVEVGSTRGEKVLMALNAKPAKPKDVAAARAAVAQAAKGQRKMPKSAPTVLAGATDSPRWADIAQRCLNCASCTQVCPTCFCNTVTDTTTLDGSGAERWRHWDSCFTLDFSYIHGGAIRGDGAHRYRQWMTHKLSHWFEQFGTSGCVGCGRCITWCPVGIDITLEARGFVKDAKGKRKG